MSKSLKQIHEDVPADHYDRGIKNNFFQKIWHGRRFSEVSSMLIPTSGPILDVGCHAGTFTNVILKSSGSKKIYGVDISPSAIKLIKKRFPNGNFQVADGAKLPLNSNFFSAVVCLEMLEHVENPEEVLSEIKRVLRKDGYGLILVPSDSSLFRFVWKVWTAIYPVWQHAHVQSFRGDALEKLIRKQGLKIKKSKKFNLGMLHLVMVSK